MEKQGICRHHCAMRADTAPPGETALWAVRVRGMWPLQHLCTAHQFGGSGVAGQGVRGMTKSTWGSTHAIIWHVRSEP